MSSGSHVLGDLMIRTGVVRAPNLGFILAFDPSLEDREIPHTISMRWRAGTFNQGRARFSAHSCCIIDDPEYGVVKIGVQGSYSVETRAGVTAGNLFDNMNPKPAEPRFGDIRSVSEIGRKAYAVGFGGIVYRLDDPSTWTRIDEGLPRNFDIEAIHGQSQDALYAVGFNGQIWSFRNRRWSKEETPTNAVLSAVKCCGDGTVFAAGHHGVILRGRDRRWGLIDYGSLDDDVWGLELFNGDVYVSTMSGVYRLLEERLEPVNFGPDPPQTTYQLSAAPGVLWSIGRRDVVSFDGTRWSRVI